MMFLKIFWMILARLYLVIFDAIHIIYSKLFEIPFQRISYLNKKKSEIIRLSIIKDRNV